MKPSEPLVSDHDATAVERHTPYRRAIIVSVALHVVLAIVLLCWYLPNRNDAKPAAVAAANDRSDESKESSKPPPPQPITDVPAEQIQESIESQIEQAKKLTDEKKLSELERNLRRLDSIASPDSVKDVTGKIASTLGLDQSQYRPNKAPADGPFDANSAQLQDVTRQPADAGGWQYTSVLVDAEGRTMTVPMTAAEGETVYNTFQQMKKFPLAEGIYRGIVMPLIQKMLEE